jgi:hypothetical protein
VIASVRILPRVKPGAAGRLDALGLAMMATGLVLLTYGLAEIGSTGSFTAVKVLVPSLVGVAWSAFASTRCACPEAAARPAPVPAHDVRIGLVRDVLPRRRAVRRLDPAAPLLAGHPPRERDLDRAC